MRKQYAIPLGRLRETIASLEHPERSAYRSGLGAFADYTIQTWPNREAMARSIRMQQRGAPRSDHWRAVVELSTTEGY